MKLNDKSIKVAGSANIRELNRQYNWSLPDEGPNTLSGLIIEELGTIPNSRVCLKIGKITIEVTNWRGRKIDWVTVTDVKCNSKSFEEKS
jgi:Mg2+/Co2+ transporter CorB